MKTYIFALALSGLTVLTASAQDDAKQRKDVTYSTHNYKHPNKAAAAQKWANQQGEGISAPAVTNRTVVNYKQPRPNAEPVNGIVVPHTAQENLANRNYKIQRLNVANQDTPVTEVAGSTAKDALPQENE
ncbi:hypothetical protein GCM10028803_48200 [Larkinella knui]|uniref:Uncharacterized protein n=1 Tax=Larkinella knui TaxID=2025310 RepID=A0A3P1CQ68_9BACT|nr:hypothetical protein [Larkinella knui]RRB15398.1 hypothetical protein EHT87_12760 [Larkinella knui]